MRYRRLLRYTAAYTIAVIHGLRTGFRRDPRPQDLNGNMCEASRTRSLTSVRAQLLTVTRGSDIGPLTTVSRQDSGALARQRATASTNSNRQRPGGGCADRTLTGRVSEGYCGKRATGTVTHPHHHQLPLFPSPNATFSNLLKWDALPLPEHAILYLPLPHCARRHASRPRDRRPARRRP